MSYRDDVDALEARHRAIEHEVREKNRELDDAAKLLADAKKARLPIIDNIRIASPCPVDWSSMIGDDLSRHCLKCDKTVFDLSNLTRDEAETLIVERAGNLCARYYQRADGKIQLADCAERRTRRTALAAVVLASAAAGGTIAVARAVSSDEAPKPVVIRTTRYDVEPLPQKKKPPEIKIREEGYHTAGVIRLDRDNLKLQLDRLEAERKAIEAKKTVEMLRKQKLRPSESE